MIKKAARIIISLIITALVLIGILYIQAPVYDFPAATPFSGDSLINPYKQIGNYTLKCNFHAHSKAWAGVTNGTNSSEEITTAYAKHGYAVAAISNYHSIGPEKQSKSPLYMPVYEHGYNIFKSHALAINAQKVSYFDYPLLQSASQKQHIINILSSKCKAVALAHPNFMNGHTVEDMQQLAGYNLVEVLNHYRISDTEWDAALTAGRLVYGVGNDDTHSIKGEPTFKMWTEVYPDTNNARSITNALIKGKSFAVQLMHHDRNIGINYIKTGHDTVFFNFYGPCNTVEFWGPKHTLMGVFKGTVGFYVLPKETGYVRLTAKSKHCKLYLNPIARSRDGKTAGIGPALPTINLWKTWLYRLGVLVVELLLIALFLYMWKLKPFRK